MLRPWSLRMTFRRLTGSGDGCKDPVGSGVGITRAVHDMTCELVHRLAVSEVTYPGTQSPYRDRLDLVACSPHPAIA